MSCFSRKTPVLTLALECLWLIWSTLVKAASAIFLIEMLYCHFVKACLNYWLLTLWNKFYELTSEVAKNFNLARFSTENWSIYLYKRSFSSLTAYSYELMFSKLFIYSV